MNLIKTQTIDNGYTKSIKIPNGEITAYINNKNGRVGYYIERKTADEQGVETENMFLRIVSLGLTIKESNLEDILHILVKNYQ